MELTVFTALISSIQGILGIASDLTKAEERRREKVASWMQELSEIVNEIADKLELNEYPYNTCAQMEIMVDHFPDIVGDLVHPKKLEVITNMLRNSTKIEQLYGELSTIDKAERDQMIVALLLASGKLEGLASIIRHMD